MPQRPLRVLQIASTSLMGGAEQMILHLVGHADRKRLECEVLSLMGPGELTDRARKAGARATNWGLRRMWNPFLWRRMRRFLREGRFDLVHCYGLRADLITRRIARELGVACISSISSPDPWRRRHHVALDRLTADGVTAWVAVCAAARMTRVTREGFPAERIHVVLNGIPDRPPPDEEARRGARERLGLDPSTPVLATVANLRPAKGYPDLIETMALLRERVPEAVCLCAGRDDSKGRMARLAEQRGVADRMRWMGFVEDTEALLAAADLAVLASHWEGCPVNLLEAMRAGRASVATEVGGIPELIDDGVEGLLVSPGDPSALANAIAGLLKNPDRREAMALAARRRFLERFTVERMVDRLTEIYEIYAR